LLVKPECFLCCLMLEIWEPLICLQPAIYWAMYSQHSRHKWYPKNRKSCNDLLCQHIKYLPSPAYCYYLSSDKDLKRISAKLTWGQDSNQERATRLTLLRAMAPLTYQLWQGLEFTYLLWSMIPPLWRIHKELPPQFLSLTSRDCRKTSFQIMYFDHIEATMRYCIFLHRLSPTFWFDKEYIPIIKSGQDFWGNNTYVLWEEVSTQKGTNTWKLTLAVICECRLCSYWVRSGEKCGVMGKLLMGKVE